MEKRFDMMDFEESLREHADRFTLIPTKRVWVGLYNNLHPGSRWPSKTISLLLIFSIILVGSLNNSISNKIIPVDYANPDAITLAETHNKESNKNAKNTKVNQPVSYQVSNKNILNNTSSPNNTSTNIKTIVAPDAGTILNTKQIASAAKSKEYKVENILPSANLQNLATVNEDKEKSKISSVNEIESSPVLIRDVLPPKNNSINNFLLFSKNIKTQPGDLVADEMNNQLALQAIELKSDKPRIPKKVRKGTWMYYVVPSVSTVNFTGAPISQSTVSAASPLMVNAADIAHNRISHPALSLNVGASSLVPLNKNFSLKTGVMLTYLDYKIVSNYVHPTFNSLVLKDNTGNLYMKSYNTYYGNGLGSGQVDIRNYSLQFAVPVGLNYSLLKNQKISWTVGSSIAPSVLLASRSFILSADGRNYVTDNDLMRHFNLLANFETFVTFYSSKYKIHVGPNFGYQTLSTYKKDYPEKEHLLNYGLKIGISR